VGGKFGVSGVAKGVIWMGVRPVVGLWDEGRAGNGPR
jgi:hypothetical protein